MIATLGRTDMEQDTAPPLPTPPSEWMNATEIATMLGVSFQRISQLLPDAQAAGVTVNRDAKGAARSINAIQFVAWWGKRKDRRRKK